MSKFELEKLADNAISAEESAKEAEEVFEKAKADGAIPPDLEQLESIAKRLRNAATEAMALAKKAEDAEIQKKASEETRPTKRFVVSNCSQLNVRTNPSKNGSVILILNIGDEIEVTAQKDGWARITTGDGIKGFVVEEFIKEA